MTDKYLTIESVGGVLRSNEIDTDGYGMEVKAGLTGLGLPSVSVQFDETVGDGARYRGRRVNQRTLDVSFNVYVPEDDEDGLQEQVDRIALVLSYPCTITWNKPSTDEAWSITGYRTGGGDYAYGVDGNGRNFLSTSITMTTDTPYWKSTYDSSQSGVGSLFVSNPGTAPSAPTWTIPGPTLGFMARSAAGERLQFLGMIDAGTTLTIDCETGTVRDSRGVNRYREMAYGSKFWKIPPGESNVQVFVDRSSTGYTDTYAEPRTNFVTNPNFTDNATGWTLAGFDYDAANDRIVQNATANGIRPSARITCSGLTPGKNYVVRFSCDLPAFTAFYPNATTVPMQVVVRDGGTDKLTTLVGDVTSPVIEFTAENSSVDLIVYPTVQLSNTGVYLRSTGWIDNAFLGDSGAYFDGDTADTADITYAWTGTARLSTSTATPSSVPSTGSGVGLTFGARKEWLV